jgi:hypothetical protein
LAIRADEIRIAKSALGGGAVALKAGPKIAPGKSAKHRRTSRLRAFAL